MWFGPQGGFLRLIEIGREAAERSAASCRAASRCYAKVNKPLGQVRRYLGHGEYGYQQSKKIKSNDTCLPASWHVYRKCSIVRCNSASMASEMFRRIIALLLILSLCGYGAAWAYAGHTDDGSDHFAGEIGGHDHDAPGEEGCDHCCHAGSHMTGLVYVIPALSHCSTDVYAISDTPSLATLAQTPPVKPPRH